MALAEASPFHVVKMLQMYADRKLFNLFCLMISEIINFSIMSTHFLFPAAFIFNNCSSLPEKHLSELKGKKIACQATFRYSITFLF